VAGAVKWLDRGLFALAVAMGAAQAWAQRYWVSADGISYLDLADAWRRGDWRAAVNASWSPLYPGLLSLSPAAPQWEIPAAHLVNYVAYLFALASFRFLLGGVMRDGWPRWVWLGLGYTLFLWSTLRQTSLAVVSPDVLVAGLVYLAAGLLLRGSSAGALGAVLGLGYLTKSSLFPLAGVFLALAGSRRRMAVAAAAFVVVAGPWVAALSRSKGRLTFGDAARLNWAWYLGGVRRFAHGQGGPHSPPQIHADPAVYEFAEPISGTYPLFYDPSYWYDGIQGEYQWSRHAQLLAANAKVYFSYLFLTHAHWLAGLLVVWWKGPGWRGVGKAVWDQKVLWIPAVAALGMYGVVHVETRYVGGFAALLWLALLGMARLPGRLLAGIGAVLLALQGLRVVKWSVEMARQERPGNENWQIAEELGGRGVRRGDRVGAVGWFLGPAWARLARVRIVADVPEDEGVRFWEATPPARAEAVRAFGRAGVRAIVAARASGDPETEGWRRLGATGRWIYVFR